MSATLQVPPAVLSTAAQVWDSTADELDPAWRRLAKTSTAGLSSTVAAALVSFREPWVNEIKAAATRAQGYSDSFVFVAGTFQVTDDDAAEKVRALLPYEYRDAEVVQR